MKYEKNNFINLKLKNWRSRLCNVLFIKDFDNGKNPLFIWSLIYNIFLQLISLLGFVPMIYSFFDNNYNETNGIGQFYFALLIIIIPYAIDYYLRFLVIDLHYNTNSYKLALRKQLLSFCSNYQFITFLLIYILTSIYGNFNNFNINFNIKNEFSNDIAMIVFSILLLLNISSIFPRFIFSTVDIKNYEITKKIIYSRRKSIIFTFLAMFFFWLLFSFIVLKLEQNYYHSLPADQIPSDAINNIGDAMYFTFIAMTTVGFGDFVPHAAATKGVVVILAIFGVCFYAYVGSIFVNIYVEYINRKKTIRNALFNNKWNEIQNKELLNSINKIMIDNLYKANLIDTNKYQQMLNDISNQNVINNTNDQLIDINDISINNQELYYKDELLGKRIFNKEIIDKEQSEEKIAIFNKTPSIVFEQMLQYLPLNIIKKIYKSNKLPILFSKVSDDYKKMKKIIFFQKKPIAEAIFQIDIAGYIELDKQMAWNMFGEFSFLKNNFYDTFFKKEDKVVVLLIKDFLFYNQKISLERFAINTNWKIDNNMLLI